MELVTEQKERIMKKLKVLRKVDREKDLKG